MKKLLAVAAAIIVVVLVVSMDVASGSEAVQPTTSWWGEYELKVRQGDVSQKANMLMAHSFGRKWGVYGFSQFSKGYAQGYLGPTYTPNSSTQFGVATGFEQDDIPNRVAGFAFKSYENFSVLAIIEYGGSGFWGKIESNYRVNHLLGFGSLIDRSDGLGPRIEIVIPGSPIKLRGATLFSWTGSHTTASISARMSF